MTAGMYDEDELDNRLCGWPTKKGRWQMLEQGEREVKP
jgi:hypothetical protein